MQCTLYVPVVGYCYVNDLNISIIRLLSAATLNYPPVDRAVFICERKEGGWLLIFIKPVQFLLHEPYFDLTPIRVIHTKDYISKF